ncbi:hypothetical protein Z043_124629, partial [Scleropages formosus]
AVEERAVWGFDPASSQGTFGRTQVSIPEQNTCFPSGVGHVSEPLGRPDRRLAAVFALFVPFFHSIPRVQVTQILGQLSITNKSLVYIVGLQLLTSSPFMWIVALGGLGAGELYLGDVLGVQRFLRVPGFVARACSRTLEPLLSGSEPNREAALGMGATLDIQRQQRMDLLDQQILLSQFAHMRRGRQQQVGLINWDRFFPNLRHRGQNLGRPQQPTPPPPPPPQPTPAASTPVSEE